MSRSTRKPPRSNRLIRGFTLVEVLVALLVLTVLLSLIATVLRTFIVQVGKTRYDYAEKAMRFSWLNSVVTSMFFYTVENHEAGLTEKDELIEAFHGGAESMQFITSSPLAFKNLCLERLYLEEGGLYLNETPVYSMQNDYRNPVETRETRKVRVLDNVARIDLTYLRRPKSIRATDTVMSVLGYSRPGALPGQSGDEKEAKETNRLDGEIPSCVRLFVTFNDGDTSEYFFKVRSDFAMKRGMTVANHSKF